MKVSREMGALYMIWEEELEDAFAEGKAEGEVLAKRIFKLHLDGKGAKEIAEMCNVSIEKVKEILE